MKKIILLCSLLLVGCASVSPWQSSEGFWKDTVHKFSVELPRGWMRFNSKDLLLITKDGVFLQTVVVERVAAGEQLSGSTMKYREGMKAEEAAEVMIENVKGSVKASRFETLERRSIEISNQPAVRILYAFRDKSGLQYQGVAIGTMKEKAFYGLHYVAPKRYYFDRDLDAFEKIVKSFRLLS